MNVPYAKHITDGFNREARLHERAERVKQLRDTASDDAINDKLGAILLDKVLDEIAMRELAEAFGAKDGDEISRDGYRLE